MVKQCHKPPTTGNGNHTTYLYKNVLKNSEIGDALWHCFTTIGPWIATRRGWLIHDQNLECLALIFLQFADAAYWKSWNYDMETQTFKDLRMWVHVIYDIYIYRIWIDNFIYKTLPLIVSIVVIYHSYVYHNYIPLIVGWNLYSFQTWLMISTDYVLRFQGRVTKFASQIARQSAPARAEWWPCWGLSSHGIMITVL